MLERRAFVRLYTTKILYPNMYTILIGGPGSGKTIAIDEADRLVKGVDDIKLAPSNVSKASLVDAIAHAVRKIPAMKAGQEYLEYNSLYVIASEFGVFLTEYSSEFITMLTKMWDNEKYEEWKRTGDRKIVIENPQVNLLGGTTPSSLSTLLPEGAWDQGFASRTLLIFSDETLVINPLADSIDPLNESLRKELQEDLRVIARAQGEFHWSDAAKTAFVSWHMSGGLPVPDHPKLVNYIPRRTIHLAKLCMIFSISRDNSMLIDICDVENALVTLIEAEYAMPEIFKSMTIKGGDTTAITEAQHYIQRAFMRDNKPVPQHKLIGFLQMRVAPHAVLRIIENMISSKMIRTVYENNSTYFVPLIPDL